MAKLYLCEEHGEQFTLEAKTMQEAREGAAIYGGHVVREITPEELEAANA